MLGGGIVSAWFARRPLIRWFVFSQKNTNIQMSAAPATENEVCLLTSKQVEGPFYFPSPERRAIREDRQGQPMTLRMQILRSPGCAPIEGAVVEVWHTDADGVYSGYPAEIAHDVWKSFVFLGKHSVQRNGEIHVEPPEKSAFLRGLQRTDANGWVEFDTLFPGWYEGRVPHIHFKVIVGGQEQLTSQFYLEQATCDRIYTTVSPYAKHGKCPQSFESDIALNQAAFGLLLKPSLSQGGPMVAVARIGIQST